MFFRELLSVSPVAWALALGLNMGILGIGIAVPAATLGGGILVFAYIATGRWEAGCDDSWLGGFNHS